MDFVYRNHDRSIFDSRNECFLNVDLAKLNYGRGITVTVH
jgi:hypothetical protein